MKQSIPSRHLVRAGAIAGVALFLWLMLRIWHPVYGFTAFLQLPASGDTLRIAAFRQIPRSSTTTRTAMTACSTPRLPTIPC